MSRPYEEVNLPGREREIELLWDIACAVLDIPDHRRHESLRKAVAALSAEIDRNDKLEELLVS